MRSLGSGILSLFLDFLSSFRKILNLLSGIILQSLPSTLFLILYSIIIPSFDAILSLSMKMILNKTIINKIQM
jgi:hypothetical protein